MKKYSKHIAALIALAACVQLTACGLSDISGLSDIPGIGGSEGQIDSNIDSDTLNKAFTEKLDKGKEIIANSEEGISAFKETAEDINEFADEASSFVSQMAEDIDAKGIIDEIRKTTGKEADAGSDTADTNESSDTESATGDKNSIDNKDATGNNDSNDKKDPTDDKDSNDNKSSDINDSSKTGGILTSAADINLTSTDGGTKNYTFVYGGETFKAKYTADHWTIYDSYKINSKSDMMIICQALIDLYPVHGSDMVSYRTAEDMTFEWQQHNIGYIFLGDKSEWASHLKDVDFDPADQGKTFDEIYKDRTGKDFKFSDFLSD